MAKFTGQSLGDFQPGGYFPVIPLPFEDHPSMHLSTLDRPEKKAQEKQISESLVMNDTHMNCTLSLGAN